MQVANNVASANKLPSSEARPGRRVNNSAAAGKLQGGELREDCVEGALLLGAAFVAYEASSVASALAPWSAVMLASRLASCAATKGCYSNRLVTGIGLTCYACKASNELVKHQTGLWTHQTGLFKPQTGLFKHQTGFPAPHRAW